MNKFYAILPVNLDLEEKLKELPTKKPINLDYVRYVLTYILSKKVYAMRVQSNFEFDIMEFDYSSIHLDSRLLRDVWYNYHNEMNWLVKSKILSRKPYKIGKCFSYRFTEDYCFKKMKYDLITDYKIIKKIRKQYDYNYYPPKKYDFLNKKLKGSQFLIDLKGAKKHLEKQEIQDTSYASYINSVVSLIELNNGKIRIACNPETDGRLHTNITQTPKSVRPFIQLNGQKLGEIDLSNSVPFFLYILLQNLNSDKIHEQSNTYYYSILQKNAKTIDNKEIQHFGKLVLAGELYKYFLDDFTKQRVEYINTACSNLLKEELTGEVDQLVRLIKKSILGMFFGKNSQFKICRRIFALHFPTILQWMEKVKISGKGKCRYKNFSSFLFRFEANYMLDQVARSFNKKNRGRVPLYSLHDCLITTQDYLDELKNFMSEQFVNLLGLSPKLKKDIWEREITSFKIVPIESKMILNAA